MAKTYTSVSIIDVNLWTENLFSFKVKRPIGFLFVAGQFSRLGIINEEKIIWRPYSIVSGIENNDYLEFYSIVIPDGAFTQKLKTIKINDEILIDDNAYGLLTADRFTSGKYLWLISTGTGLAPFISILYNSNIYKEYKNIILIHGTRYKNELNYQEIINSFTKIYTNLIYIKVLSREACLDCLQGRITNLIANNDIENHTNITIDDDSRIMICGSPGMVLETRQLLINRGLTISRRNEFGNIVVENAC